MSNARKARGSGQAPAERCTFCGRRLGRGSALRALKLKTGQVACAQCRERGGFPRLACGHFSLPGAMIVNENGDGKTFVCRACASGSQPAVDINAVVWDGRTGFEGSPLADTADSRKA